MSGAITDTSGRGRSKVLPSSLEPNGRRADEPSREHTLQIPPRQRVRVTPSKPITVSIDDENGLAMGYGVLANVSEAGACFWTDCHLEPGGELFLRVSLSHPAEVHEVAAQVVWTAEERDSSGTSMRRYGLQWRRLSFPYLLRLRQLAPERGETPSGSRPAVSRAPLLDPC